MSTICFNRAIEILGTNKVPIPGCEPTTSMTSDVLSRFNSCECVLIPLEVALAAIPGSTVKFGINAGNGIQTRWFVFPAECKKCPCSSDPDYYGILRGLCTNETQPAEEDCSIIFPMDPCVPDLRDADMAKLEQESQVTYSKEGGENLVNNLWKASPWYLYQVKKSEATGQPLPSSLTNQPIQTTNKEQVIENDLGDFQGLADILNQ